MYVGMAVNMAFRWFRLLDLIIYENAFCVDPRHSRCTGAGKFLLNTYYRFNGAKLNFFLYGEVGKFLDERRNGY
jgi:hypothetical protein